MSFPNAYEMVYWGDELRETIGLSATALGAYTLIRIAYWDKMHRNMPFFDDDHELQRITRLMGRNFNRTKKELCQFFLWSNGLIIHQVWEEKFIEACQKYEKRKQAGIASKRKIDVRGDTNLSAPGDKNFMSPNDTNIQENQSLNFSNAPAMPKQPEPEPDTYINISSEKEKYIKRKNPENELVERGLKIFNAVVEKYGGQVCKILNPAKKSRLLRRISDAGGIETFETILTEAVEKSQFLQGKIPPREGHNQFRLSMKFICQEDSFNNILNGVYNDQEPSNRVSEKGNFQPNKPASIANAIARSVSHGTIREGGYFSGQRIQI